MSVLSLSPDCVYEHEAARVQWSRFMHPHFSHMVSGEWPD